MPGLIITVLVREGDPVKEGDAVVVLEATFQNIEKGQSPAEAAIAGTKEMSMPLVASTLTTVVVFLPILLVDGIAGELFRDLVLTITTTLLCSLLIATTLVPLMAAKMMGKDHDSGFAARLRDLTSGLDRIPSSTSGRSTGRCGDANASSSSRSGSSP